MEEAALPPAAALLTIAARILDADVRLCPPPAAVRSRPWDPPLTTDRFLQMGKNKGAYHAFTMRNSCSTALLLALGSAFAVSAQTDTQTEFRQIAELLNLKPGMIVADVGAGGGSWSQLLATAVGTEGHVFATDVRPDFVAGLKATTAMQKNVTVLLGSQDDTTLPRQCCDAILLRLVYHAFRNPKAMRGSLAGALRPGGRILIIDFPGGFWAGPTAAVLEEQMGEVGFTRVALHESWQGEQGVFAVLFRKPPLN
ncbi:MAG TPA: methyltransferase domain-containing protein [Vicinamibacterales bacterium]|nr:methyltransferase domain-containing protein [Vicinamibacterales bacterium]